jgi:hypothetical protein
LLLEGGTLYHFAGLSMNRPLFYDNQLTAKMERPHLINEAFCTPNGKKLQLFEKYFDNKGCLLANSFTIIFARIFIKLIGCLYLKFTYFYNISFAG